MPLINQPSLTVSCTMDIKENLGIVDRKENEHFKHYNYAIEDCKTFINKSRRLEKEEMLKKVWLWLDGLNPPDCRTPFMETKQNPREITNSALVKVDMEITDEAYNYWLCDSNLLEDSPELSFFGNLFKSLFILESSNQSLPNELLLSNVNKKRVINSTPRVNSQEHRDVNLKVLRLVSITSINNDLYFCL